ncbi:hypothetical protein EDD85DRAFT_798682 [Armillaria nabsnona]|nr:hypothetical protein EDD85DRAFT_798682 [Armillaria nabsnona]
MCCLKELEAHLANDYGMSGDICSVEVFSETKARAFIQNGTSSLSVVNDLYMQYQLCVLALSAELLLSLNPEDWATRDTHTIGSNHYLQGKYLAQDSITNQRVAYGLVSVLFCGVVHTNIFFTLCLMSSAMRSPHTPSLEIKVKLIHCRPSIANQHDSFAMDGHSHHLSKCKECFIFNGPVYTQKR